MQADAHKRGELSAPQASACNRGTQRTDPAAGSKYYEATEVERLDKKDDSNQPTQAYRAAQWNYRFSLSSLHQPSR